MKKNKLKLSNAFYNNRFVFFFSIVCAAVVWAVVMVQFGNEQEKTITNVPVMIDYSSVESKYGLKPFGDTEFSVNLTLSGKRYIIEKSDITEEIVVKASAARVTSSGTYTLQIQVSTVDPTPEFTITNISKSEIDVFFDTYSEKDFSLDIVTVGAYGGNISEIAPSGYCVGTPISDGGSSIKVSGPDSQVSKVTAVEATVSFNEQITDTEVRDGEINIISTGPTALLNTDRINQSEAITFPVYRIVENLPVSVSFTDKPASYVSALPPSISVSISPPSADFGIRKSKAESITGVTIKNISFNSLKSGSNVFIVEGTDLVDMMVVDSDVSFRVTVTVGMNSVVRAVSSSSIELFNQPEDTRIEFVDQSINVDVVGPDASLEAITADDIQIRVDLINLTQTDTVLTVPATVALKTADDCWIFRKYDVKLIIK